jgi:hypothetical protein
MWQYRGRTIRTGKAWTDDNGVQHPANWHVWSATEKAAAGLVEIVEQTPPDSRLYKWSQNSDGTITSTAKSLDDVNQVDRDGNPVLDENGNQIVALGVKSNLKQEVKSQQNTAIPTNIQTWRDAIRTKATEMETAIDGAADTDAMAALFVTYTEEDDGSITKSGQENLY